MQPPPADGSFSPVHLGTFGLLPVESAPGTFRAHSGEVLRGEITVLVECEAAGFPFETYCRFVRQKNPDMPYTFHEMEFAPEPPGLRVGPWPGWRGIPEFTTLSVSFGNDTHPASVTFWGDEMSAGRLRFVCRIFCGAERDLTVKTPDSRITPMQASFFQTRTLLARTTPVMLSPGLDSSHPRLLITPASILSLRAGASGSNRMRWRTLLDLVAGWNRPFSKTPESKVPAGPQGLSGEDRVLISAIIALVDPAQDNIQRAQLAVREFLEETRRPGFEKLQIDTQAGEVLFVLCVGYDWLHPFMSAAQRQDTQVRLWEIADICWGHLGFERRDYGQAHYLGCGLGLLAFSFLFWKVHPNAVAWANHLRGALDCALRLVPSDGFFPHGINLWVYEFGFLLRWLELVRTCTGEDLWESTSGLDRASGFRAATLSHDGRMGITMGDSQYLVGGDSWCHDLIAARTRSPRAQWLANRLRDLPHEGIDVRNIPPRRRAYEFLFHDPSIVPEDPLQPISQFLDGGQVCVRSDTSLFTFRSGPPLGVQRYSTGECGAYGHSDPANGSFLLHRMGTFAVSGPGPLYRRDTSLHNIITINGQGQIGDSTVWLPDFMPPAMLAPLPEIRIHGDMVSLTVEYSRAYLPHLGVRHLSRSLLVDIRRWIIGIDIVRCAKVSSLEWNLHTWDSFAPDEDEQVRTWTLSNGDRVVMLSPAGVEGKTGLTDFVPAYPHDGTRDRRLTAAVRAEETTFVWCYLLTPEPAPALSAGGASGFAIHGADGCVVSFDGRWLTPGGTDAAHA